MTQFPVLKAHVGTARPPGASGEWDGWGGSTTCICSLSFAPCISCQKSEVSEMHPSLFTFYAVSAAQTAGHRPSTSYHAFQDSLQCRLVEDRYLMITNRYMCVPINWYAYKQQRHNQNQPEETIKNYNVHVIYIHVLMY